MKQCTNCGKIKPIKDGFHINRATKDGYSYRCKDCVCSNAKEWALKNKDRAKKNNANWRDKNKDAIKEKARTYHVENAETIRARVKAWRLNNPEKVKANRKAKRESDPERFRQYSRKYIKNNLLSIGIRTAIRRTKKFNATPSWADMSIIRIIYVLCRELTEVTGIEHQVDHIVPLNSHIVCGLHNEYNLQILTYLDNIKKGNRHWPDMP